MIAVGRSDVAASDARLQVMLAHEAADSLVIYRQALLSQCSLNTSPAVGLERVADGGHGFHEGGVVGAS